jgi:hypothetical protein
MLGVTLLLVVFTLLVPASSASGVSIDAECLGSFARTFSPPVTSTPNSVTVTGTYDYSTCAVGSTATGVETATLTLSCVPVTAGRHAGDSATKITSGIS